MVSAGVVSGRMRSLVAAVAALLLVVRLVAVSGPAGAQSEWWDVTLEPRVGVADGESVVRLVFTAVRLSDGSPYSSLSVLVQGFDGTVSVDGRSAPGGMSAVTDDDGRAVFELSTTVAGEQVVDLRIMEFSGQVTVRFDAPEQPEQPEQTPVLDGGRRFSDVPPDHTFADEIAWLASTGITLGREDGSFGLNDPVTRGAMAAFLYRYDGEPDGPFDAPDFSDVPDGHVFATEIAWLASTGITVGRGDGTFGVNDAVTRGAMAAFLYRYDGEPDGPFDAPEFPDVPDGHVFATEIAWLASTGITVGRADGTFGLNDAVTRGAMAAFIYRYDGDGGGEVTLSASFDGPVEVVAGGSAPVAVNVTVAGRRSLQLGVSVTVASDGPAVWEYPSALIPLEGDVGEVAAQVSAALDADPGMVAAQMTVSICALSVGGSLGCDGEVLDSQTLSVEAEVLASDPATAGDAVLVPAPHRWAADPDDDAIATLPDEIIFRLDTDQIVEADRDVRAAVIAEDLGALLLGGIRLTGTYQLGFPTGRPGDIETVLEARPEVVGVIEHYGFAHVTTSGDLPQVLPDDYDNYDPYSRVDAANWNDPYDLRTWGLQAINAPAAWDITTGSSDVRVGVIDWDIRPNHPDLAPNLVRMHENYRPTGYGTGWGSQHGTHVAGTACARGNNGFGAAGVAWQCSLYGYDLSRHPGDGSYRSAATISEAMEHAALDDELDVVNMSLGFPQIPARDSASKCELRADHLALAQELEELHFAPMVEAIAQVRDVLWVLAAGNDCRPIDYTVPQRLAPRYDNVVAVASVDADGSLSHFSSWGPGVVAAPGGFATSQQGTIPAETPAVYSALAWACRIEGPVITCGPGYGSEYWWGTSMASPHVAGVAALMRSAEPDISAAQMAGCLQQSTAGRQVGAPARHVQDWATTPVTEQDRAGIGIVDAHAAVQCAMGMLDPEDGGGGTDPVDLGWPTHRSDGSSVLYVYFGALLVFPSWVSCTPDWCIGQAGDDLHVFDVSSGIEYLGRRSIAGDDRPPAVILAEIGFTDEDIAALLA